MTRRDRAWGRQRRRPLIAVATPLGLFAALSCSSLLGVVIQHVA